jgi:hypothetical protein
LTEFLSSYRWLESVYGEDERPEDIALQIEFLKKEKHGIDSWFIVAPQIRTSFGPALRLDGVGELFVKKRHRIADRGFQVFGEPAHRTIAGLLAQVEEEAEGIIPNGQTRALQGGSHGVLLLYPVRNSDQDEVSIGFELQYPKNDLPFDLNFTVRKATGRRGEVVVST